VTCDCAELDDCQPLGVRMHPEWTRSSEGELWGCSTGRIFNACSIKSFAVLLLSTMPHALMHFCTIALAQLFSDTHYALCVVLSCRTKLQSAFGKINAFEFGGACQINADEGLCAKSTCVQPRS